MRETTADILKARGYRVVTAEDGFKAIEQVRKSSFNLALIDIAMPGINGVETCKEIKKIRPRIKAIMMTASAVNEPIEEALRECVCQVVHKPLDINGMITLIESAVPRRDLLKKRRRQSV